MVHQHFMLVPNFSVLENIILGHEGGGSLQTGLEKATSELQNIAEKYGLQVDLHALVQDLPVGLQQRVEILKALYRGARGADLGRANRCFDPARNPATI